MADIASLEAELEVVTPIWMGGADRKTELRPPTVRGCLRFWFRALAGGVLGEDLRSVRQAESAVFGSTNRASPGVVRLSGSPRSSVSVTDQAEQPPGVAYMLWSVLQQKRDAILPGERFRLRLNTRPVPLVPVKVEGRTFGMAESFEMAAASLWRLVRLGGIGARARRGGGGVSVAADPDGWPKCLPSLVSAAKTPAELAAELGDGIERVRQAAGWSANPPGDLSAFDVLHERVCELHLADVTFPTWWEALNWAGEQFKAYRIEQKLDATGAAALLIHGKMAAQTIQRAILGLPIAFFFNLRPQSVFSSISNRACAWAAENPRARSTCPSSGRPRPVTR